MRLYDAPDPGAVAGSWVPGLEPLNAALVTKQVWRLISGWNWGLWGPPKVWEKKEAVAISPVPQLLEFQRQRKNERDRERKRRRGRGREGGTDGEREGEGKRESGALTGSYFLFCPIRRRDG